MTAITDSIVAREAELDAVRRFVSDLDDRPRALVIEGDAGIGKTTVWRAAVAAAEASGYRVLQARPGESEAELPYAALGDLVSAVYDETRPRLPVPQRRALDVALLRSEAEERADPRATAAALVAVLSAVADASPTVVAIDDVQWVDPATERALAFAARRLPPRLGLLVARRGAGEGEPPLDLGAALDADRLERLVLGPLSLASLHHLIRAELGVAPPRPVLVRIVAASGGNPFFALEIARAFERRGDVDAPSDPLPIPETLQDLVAFRVRALSPTAQEAVLVAAALARPTAATVAAAIAGRGDARVALGEAEDAGLLVEDARQIRFSHPLVAAAIHAAAAPMRRRQLHRRLAEVVADPAERARHLALGVLEPDAATAAELAQAAGRAARRGAPDAAAALYEASQRLTAADDAEQLARRVLGEAAALLAAGERARARAVAERAVEAAPAGAIRADALMLLADIAWSDHTERAAAEYLERALVEARDDRELRARIHVSLAHYDPARTLEHADAALLLVDAEREPRTAATALIAKLFAEASIGRGASLQHLKRALELEARAGPDVRKSELALIWYVCTDEVEAARARHEEEDLWFRDRGLDDWRAERLAFRAVAELHAGQWEVAVRAIDQSHAVLEQFEPRGPFAVARSFRALIDAHRGMIARARATLLPLVEQARGARSDFWECWLLSTLAFVEYADRNHAAVDKTLTRMSEVADAIGGQETIFDRSEPNHIESLIALGELDRARAVLAHLEWRGQTLPRPWIAATLPRARALVLAAEGHLLCALAAFDELELAHASPLPFELARTLLVQGTLLRRAKQRTASADVLARALAIFEALGAPAWSAQTRGELDRVGLRRTSDDLTPTERRVAELSAGGLTNREVARAAFISPKTVEANLARIYRKLGISSRAELGAHVARNPSPAAHEDA